MSDEIEIAIDSNETIVESELIIDVVNNNNIVDIESSEPDVVVTFKKQEYVITGDDMYIPLSYDEAPQWLKDTITNITDFSLNQKLTEIGALSSTLYGLIDELNVAKNTYTMSIINSAEIDERINARIETLNSSLSGSDATIVDLIATKATPTEALALALNVLTASINDGAISSLVSNLQNAISTTNSTLSNNIDIVHSEMTGEFEATSDAVSGLQTYIGVDNDGIANGTGLLSDVKILQKQNDGVIETNTGTWDVMIGIEDPNNNTDNDQLDIAQKPYATWKSLDAISGNTENRSAHVGDVYIKYTNAVEGYKTYDKAYKFIKVVPDATSPYSTDSEGFTWAVITDTDAQNAYVAALNALDLADSKRRVFVDTPTVPYNEGDLWVRSVSGGNQIYRAITDRVDNYNELDWKIADDAQVNNFVSNVYEPEMLDIQKQVDGQISYYFYDSSLGQTPASISGSNGWNTEVLKKEHHGDIAYDKSTSAGYYYDRITSSWILINSATNSGLIEALKAASIAQATADGKVSHMYGVYQSTSPATTGAYKYWLTTAKVLKVLEGASWVDFAISKLDTGDIVTVWDSGLKDEFKYYWNGNTWYSQVNGGLVAGSKAFTDLHTSLGALGTTVSGHTGQLSTVDSRISNGVATVDSKWQYNSNLIINGVSHNSGFGLSNSAGTGVGSEFWIDASKLKFTNSAKTGRVAPFTIDTTGTTPEITFNGKVSFSNVNGANMSGSNLLYNSAPAIGFETKGWQADYNDTGLASSGILATGDPYRPAGGGAFFQTIPGTPAVGKVFDMRAVGAIPVIGGQFYEGSAYLNSHRCDSRIYVGWADSAGSTITWSMGSVVTQTNAGSVLSTWGRSKFIAQAPADAVSCYYYIRGISTGEANPYVFVSMCYFGRASEGQSVFSNWSEGISAGATTTGELTNNAGFTTLGAVASQGYVLPAGVANAINTNTTTINGSKITTRSIAAEQINVTDLFSKNITYTGVITGGNVAGGGLINSYNGKMKIDLVNGSIYIA